MAAVALENSKGRQNFQRLSRLLIAGATTVGRETFDAIHPPDTLDTVLADPAREAILRASRMARPQWDKVYPSPGKFGKSKDWDLTLTHKMLRSICDLSPPATGWDDLPPDSDVSKEADLVRLKYYRNSIYGHVDERMEIKDEEYQKLWKEITEGIIRLAGHLSSAKKKEWETAIEDFLTAPLTSDDMLNVKELKDWYRQDVEMREELREIKELIKRSQPEKERDVDPIINKCSESLHEGQLLEWFCKECQECVCRTCVTLNHRAHPCINMNNPSHVETETKNLQQSAEKVRSKIEKLERGRRVVDERNVAMKDKMRRIREEVKLTADKWIQKICEEKDKVLREVEMLEQIENNGDSTQLDAVDSHINHLKTSLKFTEALATNGTAFQKFTKQSFTTKCNDDLLSTEFKTKPRPIPKFHFWSNALVVQMFNSWGIGGLWGCVADGDGLKRATVGVSSRFTISTIAVRSTSRQLLYNPTLTVDVAIQSDYGDVSHVIHDNKDGTYIVSFTPLHPGDHHISVIVDEQRIPQYAYTVFVNQWTLTANNSETGTVGLKCQLKLCCCNRAVEKGMYDSSTTVHVKIQAPQGTLTTAIHDNKDGTYLISFFPVRPGDHRVSATVQNKLLEHGCGQEIKTRQQKITVIPVTVTVKPREYRPVLTLGKEGVQKGEFYYPWDVAVNDKDEIIVVDSDNHRIQVFNCKGEHLRTIGRVGLCRVTTDKDNNVIVLDTFNSCVQIFSEPGDFVRSFGSEGRNNGEMKQPRGLSMDSDGNIIVTDRGNNRVQLFSSEGEWLNSFYCGDEPWDCVAQGDRYFVSLPSDHCVKVFDKSGAFLCKYGTHGSSSGEFQFPTGLAVDKAGNLVVCDNENHRLQMLRMDGTFVGSCGTRGDIPGQFNIPISVAVMGDGKLVVCDNGNHRFQILK